MKNAFRRVIAALNSDYCPYQKAFLLMAGAYVGAMLIRVIISLYNLT